MRILSRIIINSDLVDSFMKSVIPKNLKIFPMVKII